MSGGNDAVGTISDSGMYSAPARMPDSLAVTVMAVANADTSKTAQAAVTLTQPSSPMPALPTGLSASMVAPTSVAFTWQATADDSIAGYYVYRDGVRIDTVTSAGYSDSGLAAGTSYSYQVATFDQSTPRNVSPLSAPLTVTTAADTQSPTTPAGLTVANVTLTSVTLSWGASADLPSPGGTGVGGYTVYRNGVPVATVTSTGYTDTGLTASTIYSYQLAAFDSATPANVSALSAALSVSTAADMQAPTVPLGLTVSNIAPASITLSWGASTDLPNPGATGVAGYYVYRNGARVATVTGTGYTDTGLKASTTYSYQVAAFDQAVPANVSALSAALSVTTAADTQAPTVPAGLKDSNITLVSITLGWSASTDLPNPGATGVAGYYVYRNGVRVATVTGTGYTDTGLTASTTYSYQVAAFDKATPANVSALSAALSVTTAADTQAPTVPGGVTAANTAAGSTTLSWAASTDLPNPGATGVAGYYVYRDGVLVATVAGTGYTDSGLSGSTTYSYQVAAFDSATPANVSALSIALSVTTPADVPAPTLPAGLTASNISAGNVTLSWNASTDPGGGGVAGYYVYRNGVRVATVTGTSYTDTGLVAASTYSYQIAAFDMATPPVVSTFSAALSVTTSADTQPPTVPVGLTASGVAAGSATLSWSASTDLPNNPGATGVGGYTVYRNGVRIATVTGTSYSDSGLSASTTYSYQVAAFDKATPVNVSALSAALSVTTSADTQAPTVPIGLTASSITAGSIRLGWSASTDLPNPGATGVGGYYVYRNGVRVATVTGTAYTNSGLTAATTYSYQVAAFDNATPANVSALSAALSVTTTADTQAPTVPTGLAASTMAAGSLTLSWSASTDLPNPGATGVGGYYVYRNGVRIATVTGTSYSDSGLTAATSYSYQLAAFDLATPVNVSALCAALSVTTSADTQAPTVPTGLTASSITAGSIKLGWSASTDLPNPGASGVGGYYVYRNGARVATVTGTSYINTALTAATAYSYQVAAFDNATPANVSALSAALSVTTLADTQAPTVPTGLAASTMAAGRLTLSWSASTDLPNPGATGVGGYYVYRNGARIATATGTSYADSGLSASGSYSYQVAAFDKATPVNVSTLSAAVSVGAASDVLTYHNDTMRTGQNLTETMLTPANVISATFGLLQILHADDPVDATPLIASNVSAGGSSHNVVYVATEHGSVYAYDADSFALLAHVSLIGSGEVPSDTRSCGQVGPEIGITSTPVIDRGVGTNGTLYVVVMSKDSSGNYYHRLHALDLATLADRLPAIVIQGTYPGNGANSVNGVQTFQPGQYKERGALLAANGQIYTVWASNCDFTPYTGWIMAYDETTLNQTAVLNYTPNGSMGAIWNVAGLTADNSGNVYGMAGNGTFDTTLSATGFPIHADYGNAVIKLSGTSGALAVTDYFTMWNTVSESNQDVDLGSGSPLLLPDQTDANGTTRHLLVGAGKDGNVLLLDRDNLGKFNTTTNQVYQILWGGLPGGLFSAFAYFNGSVYVADVGGKLKAFALNEAQLSATPTSQSGASFAYPGASPSVSANGSSNAIVWAVLSGTGAAAVLHAYNPANLAQEYYNSTQAPSGRDGFGNGEKYITPVVANGKVFVGTPSGVAVFGVLQH